MSTSAALSDDFREPTREQDLMPMPEDWHNAETKRATGVEPATFGLGSQRSTN
jgi:hypothetical protein